MTYVKSMPSCDYSHGQRIADDFFWRRPTASFDDARREALEVWHRYGSETFRGFVSEIDIRFDDGSWRNWRVEQ